MFKQVLVIGGRIVKGKGGIPGRNVGEPETCK